MAHNAWAAGVAACSLSAWVVASARPQPSATLVLGIVVGCAARLGLVGLGLGAALGEQAELSSGSATLAAVREGAFLAAQGRPAREGGVFLGPPLLVAWLGPAALSAQPLWAGAVLCAADVLLALTLWLTAGALGAQPAARDEERMLCATVVDRETGLNNRGLRDFVNAGLARALPRADAPTAAALVLLLNPWSVLACAAGSTAQLGALLAAQALLAALLASSAPVVGLLLALAAYLDAAYWVIAVPVTLQLLQPSTGGGSSGCGLAARAGRAMCALATAAVSSAALVAVSAGSWDRELLLREAAALLETHRAPYELRSLAPNVGLWWYLFTEVFPHARQFFRLVLCAMPLAAVPPLCVALRTRPVLLGHLLLVAYLVWRPYPDLGGVGVLLAALVAHPHSLVRMPAIEAWLVGAVATASMLPVMRYMWLAVGSGNANYYYFQTLGLQLCLANIISAFAHASVVRDEHLRLWRVGETTKCE
jgi:hypothetical protein